MPTPEESRALAMAVAADLSDLIPPLPGLDFVGQVVDAAATQTIRSTFPMEKRSSISSLLENIEIPGVAFIPGVGPLLAKAPDLVPGHTLGVLTALKERYGSLGAAGISLPKVKIPPPPPPPAVRGKLPEVRFSVPAPPKVRVSLPKLRLK